MISSTSAYMLLRSLGVYIPNLQDARMNAMVNHYQPAMVTAVNGQTDRVRACISSIEPGQIVPDVFSQPRFNAAKRILDFINLGGTTIAARERINVVELVLVHLQLSVNAFTALRVGDYPTILQVSQDWPNLLPAEQAALRDYVRSRAAANALRNLADMSNVDGASILGNLKAIAQISAAVNAVRPGDDQRFSGITPTSLRDLGTLHGAHPPNARFPGFAAWGPGDHQAPDRNIRWHFLKHVLGILEEDVEGEDPNEQAEWWQTLGIQLTWAQVQQHASSHPPLAPQQPLFYGPNNLLTIANVPLFLSQVTLTDHPRLVNYLTVTYEPAYRDRAIQASRTMDEVLVQSNGNKTFVCGRKTVPAGDQFIIGRVVNGVLGLSSCYFAANIHQKMAGARANLVWDLV